MIEYDEREKKMVLKLVYYGPALSGKTTNLLKLHDLISENGKGDLMMLDTKDDRTIFFDLLPLFCTFPVGVRIKVKTYTVPGQVRHDATRKAVLTRADGIVFVADSQLGEMRNNFESFENLEKNLAFVGIDLEKIPLIVQFNKRDLEGTISEEEIDGIWKPTGLPVVLASALYGKGVLETYSMLIDLVYDSIQPRYGIADRYMVTKEAFRAGLVRIENSREVNDDL